MGVFKEKLQAAFAFFKPAAKQLELPIPMGQSIKSTEFPSPAKRTEALKSTGSPRRIDVPPAHLVKERVTRTDLSADVVIHDDAKVIVNTQIVASYKLLESFEKIGRKKSIHLYPNAEKREISLGLDFGTSSVKVVIGDHGSDQAYAVPFLVSAGINPYLLPSRVFIKSQSSNPAPTDQFSLEKSEFAYRDLKLGLLGDPENRDRQIQVIGFLAQVVHRSRSWLFSKHSVIYKDINCLWRLRIGLPAASSLNNELVPIFSKIAHASWLLAAITGSPTLGQTEEIRDAVFDRDHVDPELEVEIIAEIAAQIYGFVVSTSFDRKAPNRFLMVDVGAGTVDASLFKVMPVKGGKWDFEFYTAVIQPYGVSNLHAARVDWWLNNLPNTQEASNLKDALKTSKFSTDLGYQLPKKCENYVTGVEFKHVHPAQCDYEFFDKKLTAQVQGSAVWRAFRDGYLDKEQLKDTPMFLCGGGSRDSFYADLEKLVQHPPGFSWLSVQPWQLAFPRDLIAEGVPPEDFDRLSVAYGLSKLEVGRVTKAMPLPKVSQPSLVSFVDRFIDKDQI